MRQSTSKIIEQKNKPTLSYYVLYELNLGSSALRFVNNDTAITFDGNIYQPFAVAHSQISENSNNEVETIQITVSNISRYAQQLCEDNELRKKSIKIIIVFKDELATNTAKIEDIFYIDTYEISEQNVIFTCTSKLDVLNVVLPGRIYTRTYCKWQFKGVECKYAGAETSCTKKFDRCIELNNTENFGGFPGIPSKKVYVI